MNEAAEVELRAAIEAIEKVSATEVVVAVRPRLRRWLGPHLLIGAATVLAVLCFVLFSDDYEFALWSIAVAPLLAALAGGMAVEAVAPLERALVPAAVRDDLLREAAHATFHELGVHGTRGRTGVLVFIAVRERRVLLVGDLEVVVRLGAPVLARHATVLTTALPAGGVAVARALAALAAEYAAALPRASDDINELGDLVTVRSSARRFRGSVR